VLLSGLPTKVSYEFQISASVTRFSDRRNLIRKTLQFCLSKDSLSPGLGLNIVMQKFVSILEERMIDIYILEAARGGAVGSDTALQGGSSLVRFPMVSLEFFIDIIPLAALWPWS